MTRRVAVVGAGAVGVTAAQVLAEQGADVTVYERDNVGSGSTGRAAGIVYDAFAGAVDAELAARALDQFRDLADEGLPFAASPYVWFATEPGAAARAVREDAERMRERGRDVEVVDAAWLRERYPQVRADDVTVAAVARDAGVVEPAAYADLVADRASAAGAEIRTGEAVAVRGDPPRVLVDSAAQRYDAVLVAAGAHTGPLLADAGVSLPLAAYRAQALLASAPAVPILYDATDRYYLRPHRNGVIAGDGTRRARTAPDEWDADADPEFVAATRDRLDERLVNFEGTVRESWAGLCTATPDRNPLLGEAGGGLFVAAGWHGHGFMLAPATGAAVADQLLGGDGIDAFGPGRFDGDETVTVPGGVTVEDEAFE